MAVSFGKRHILVLWLFTGFVNLYILRACINVAIVSMVYENKTTTADQATNNRTDICPLPTPVDNGTSNATHQGEFMWNRADRGLILSAFYYGYICTQFIGGYLPQIIGGRLLFGIGVGGTALLTLLNPVAARQSKEFLIAVRALEGVFEGVTMPCSHFLLGNWAPKQERSMLVLFPATGANIGTVLSAPLTGLLCEFGFDGGWPSSFYIWGSIGILWCIGWFYFVRDSPSQHPSISKDERRYIEENCQSSTKPTSFQEVPWKSIALSPAVWAVIVAQFGYSWNYNSSLTGISTYLNDVLHISATLNGVISSVPYIALWLVQVLAGFFADFLRAKGIRTTWVRKLSYAIGMALSSICLCAIQQGGCNVAIVVVLLCISIGSSGLAYAGVIVNSVDIAPKYAAVIMGIANTFACIPGIVAPTLTGAIVNEESSISTWQIVFCISGGISLGCALIFAIFGNGEVQKWAQLNSEEDLNTKITANHYEEETF